MFRTVFAVAVIALCAGAAIAQDLQQKVDPWVMEKTAGGQAEFLVMLREQAENVAAFEGKRLAPAGAASLQIYRMLAPAATRGARRSSRARSPSHRAHRACGPSRRGC